MSVRKLFRSIFIKKLRKWMFLAAIPERYFLSNQKIRSQKKYWKNVAAFSKNSEKLKSKENVNKKSETFFTLCGFGRTSFPGWLMYGVRGITTIEACLKLSPHDTGPSTNNTINPHATSVSTWAPREIRILASYPGALRCAFRLFSEPQGYSGKSDTISNSCFSNPNCRGYFLGIALPETVGFKEAPGLASPGKHVGCWDLLRERSDKDFIGFAFSLIFDEFSSKIHRFLVRTWFEQPTCLPRVGRRASPGQASATIRFVW